jgi:hypothetical protein
MTGTTRRTDTPGGVDLVAELRRLSTADRLVDVSVVPGPMSQWCCDRPAVVFVAFDEPCGLSTRHWERDLCVECAREVISRTRADYVDVEVRIPEVAS